MWEGESSIVAIKVAEFPWIHSKVSQTAHLLFHVLYYEMGLRK